jgi:hypothetical protein
MAVVSVALATALVATTDNPKTLLRELLKTA